ncbi:MAG: EamA family transporter [Rubrivivax sp.]
MPIEALGLVLFAAIVHASWNIVAKRAGGDWRFALLSNILTSLLWLPAGLWVGWSEMPRWGTGQWLIVTGSAVLHVLYMNTLLAGYRAADLTVVYPLARGSAPLLTALAAVLLLGERLSAVALTGVLAVCGGVFLIAGGPALWQAGGDPAQRIRLLAGLRWGAATGVLIASYSVVDGYAIKELLMAPVLYYYVSSALRVPLQLPSAAFDRIGFMKVVRAQWRPALVVAILSPLAYVAVLVALTIAPLSHVAPAREASMLFAALLGGRLLGESNRGARLLGAACIAGGVIALAVG